jgi:hypothetical protein
MKRRLLPAIVLALSLVLSVVGIAFAHGTTQAGDYTLVIGFHNEPVLVGMPNSLDLFVTNTQTGEKINGLESTLQAEISFGSSKKTLKIYPQEDIDGAYSADLVPAKVGDYTWHIFGKINDQVVDVSMTAAPDTFGSVEPLSNYAFPAAGSGAAEAAASAQTALYVGIAGIVLGLAGLVIGISALRRR